MHSNPDLDKMSRGVGTPGIRGKSKKSQSNNCKKLSVFDLQI